MIASVVWLLICEVCRESNGSVFPFLQAIINHGALPMLLSLLTHNHKKSIKKEACWTISNITAGNREQVQVSK